MDCPLCRSGAGFFVRAHNRDYYHCATCRLIAVPRALHLSREAEAARYREHENSLDNPGYVDMFRDKIRLVQAHCPGVQTVLDYGCGYAPVLVELLRHEGYDAEGHDPLFFPEPPKRDRYDLVLSTETFEHFADPAREMDRIRALLTPGGFLAVMTRLYPQIGGEPDARAFSEWYYQRDPTHVAFYCTHTFEWLGRRYGLETVFNNGKDFVILQRRAESA